MKDIPYLIRQYNRLINEPKTQKREKIILKTQQSLILSANNFNHFQIILEGKVKSTTSGELNFDLNFLNLGINLKKSIDQCEWLIKFMETNKSDFQNDFFNEKMLYLWQEYMSLVIDRFVGGGYISIKRKVFIKKIVGDAQQLEYFQNLKNCKHIFFILKKVLKDDKELVLG